MNSENCIPESSSSKKQQSLEAYTSTVIRKDAMAIDSTMTAAR